MGLAIKHQLNLPPAPTVQKCKEKREEKRRSIIFKYHPVMFGKQFIVCWEVYGPSQPRHHIGRVWYEAEKVKRDLACCCRLGWALLAASKPLPFLSALPFSLPG